MKQKLVLLLSLFFLPLSSFAEQKSQSVEEGTTQTETEKKVILPLKKQKKLKKPSQQQESEIQKPQSEVELAPPAPPVY